MTPTATPPPPATPAQEPAPSPLDDRRKTHRLAIRAIVAAGLGFSVLPVVGSILGFVLAARAQRAIEADSARFKGQDLVRWARGLGVLAVVLWIVGSVVVWIAYRYMHS